MVPHIETCFARWRSEMMFQHGRTLVPDFLDDFHQACCLRRRGDTFRRKLQMPLWFVTVDNLERCLPSGAIDLVVMGKLSQGQPCSPVFLLIISKTSEVPFHPLVCSFGLSVCFWVVSRGAMQINPQLLIQGSCEVAVEGGSPIQSCSRRQPVVTPDLIYE